MTNIKKKDPRKRETGQSLSPIEGGMSPIARILVVLFLVVQSRTDSVSGSSRKLSH